MDQQVFERSKRGLVERLWYSDLVVYVADAKTFFKVCGADEIDAKSGRGTCFEILRSRSASRVVNGQSVRTDRCFLNDSRTSLDDDLLPFGTMTSRCSLRPMTEIVGPRQADEVHASRNRVGIKAKSLAHFPSHDRTSPSYVSLCQSH